MIYANPVPRNEVYYLGFDELEPLRRFLAAKLEKHVPSLEYYSDQNFAGFYHKHEKDKPRMSKSSTSTCALSLISAGKWNAGPWKDNAAQTLRVFLTDRCQSAELKTNNPFTVAFVLEAAHALMQFVPSSLSPRLRRRMRLAEKLLKTEIITGSVSLLGYPPSAYLTQLVTRVLASRNAVDDATRSRILDWPWRELDHQLALLHANSKNADVFQLAYCMILVSDVGDPGEATPEQSLISQTALDVFFERQLPDGSWPRSRPPFITPV